MATLTTVNRQLATRPDDERFIGLSPLKAHLDRLDKVTGAAVYGTDKLQFQVIDQAGNVLSAPREDGQIVIMGPGGKPGIPTHWAWRQFGGLLGAPSDYLATLAQDPQGALAARDALNVGLRTRPVERVGLLLRRPDQAVEIHAATGPNYGRVRNSDVVDKLIEFAGDGLTGPWRVPGEFGKKVQIGKHNTTIFGGDRDIFVFLANEDSRVTVKGRRDGKDGEMARGVIVRNSEVGSGVLGIQIFYFDYVCSNRIIWGAEGVQSIRIKHTSGAPDRWLREAAPKIQEFARASTVNLNRAIAAAQRAALPAPAPEFLRKWFTAPVTEKICAAHMTAENRPIETLWDASTGVTEYAKTIPWQDARVKVEETAGTILDLAL